MVIAAVRPSSSFVTTMFLAGLRGMDDEIQKVAQTDCASH
jgi:ABC-type sugar transport system permease subunit